MSEVRGEARRAPVTAAAMPCSCFGKKDKKAGASAEKYSREPEKEPLTTQTSAPAPAEAPAPTQTEPVPATPPTPVTPTSADARLRPEDDPDKASRRRDVVASFYSDQCELIGFKATGSRPPSAVVGSGGENPSATSSPLVSPPSSSRASALSRADLALKRREFFKDLAVNDLNSSRYGTSEPSWRLVDSGSLTTPRRSHQQDGHHHHTLPAQARFGGVVLRPISTPSKATSGPDLRIINGESLDSLDHQKHDDKVSESEPLLGGGAPQEAAAHRQEAGVQEPLLATQLSQGDQSTPASPATPPVTPATPPPTPPARAEPSAPEMPSFEQPLASEALIELAATHLEGSSMAPQREEGQLVVQQQYMQQVSVGSDDERLGEGSCILIKEAFPEEPLAHPDTSSHDVPATTNASGTTPAPSVTHEAEAARHVSQHSSEQPTTPPPTGSPGQRRPSFPKEEEEREELSRLTDQAALDSDQDLRRATSSPETSPPGSPQESRQLHVGESVTAAATELHPDAPQPKQESGGSPEEARLSPTIVGCIPKAAPTQEAEGSPPSPPNTPPTNHSPTTDPPTTHPPSPPAGEKTTAPAPPTQPNIDERAPPPLTPPNKSESCGVAVSSSQLEDDGLGSDIDDALSSLECLTEEGNSEKRATAST